MMSENWDYLSWVSIANYRRVPSAFRDLDVRSRILTVIFLMAALITARFPVGIISGFILVLVLMFVARMRIKDALRELLPALPFILILALLQIFFNNYKDTWQILYRNSWLTLSLSDLWAGLALALRFFALGLLLELAAFSMTMNELIKGLGALLRPLERIRFPVRDLILIVQVTLRFIPLLALTAERIAKAQAARGADWGSRKGGLWARAKRVIPILIPLFIQSLHKAEMMALAMDARGYRSSARIPVYAGKKIQPGDVLAVGVSLALMVLSFFF